uniref:Uncharacterized protein n=2 Tax=Avena sativa TaxID=4498 RepID=A0ACD5XX26_AVESA
MMHSSKEKQFLPTIMLFECWAPLRVFAWLTTLDDRCWTNDRRKRHGLTDNDTCSVCDQECETISHLLIQCSFSQQIWHDILAKLNLPMCMPRNDEEFCQWFDAAASNADPSLRKGIKSIILLTIWRLWKTRNDSVFNNINPAGRTLLYLCLRKPGCGCLQVPRRCVDWLSILVA